MAAIDEALLILDECREDIQAAMAFQNVNASGRSSAAFQVERTARGCRLVYRGDDVAPLETLEEGRGPGEMPDTERLRQWSIDKGIPFANEEDRRRFAWALALRIKRAGTLRHMSPIDVFSTCCREAAEEIKATIVNAFVKELKRK